MASDDAQSVCSTASTATRTPFRPGASNVCTTTLVDFIRTDPDKIGLQDIPGIGPTTIGHLRKQGIHEPIQLIGEFLRRYSSTVSSQEYADQMKTWLQDVVGCRGNVNTVVRVILLRIQLWIPGVCADMDVATASRTPNTLHTVAEDLQRALPDDTKDDGDGDDNGNRSTRYATRQQTAADNAS